MPRKEQGWITFQTSEEERHLLEEVCQLSQRTKTEVLRELLRGLKQLPLAEADETEADVELEPVIPLGKRGDRLQSPRQQPLRVSSRNILKGRVKRIVSGAVNSEITIEITQKVVLTSIITRTSAEDLGLEEGDDAYALIKASDVIIAVD